MRKHDSQKCCSSVSSLHAHLKCVFLELSVFGEFFLKKICELRQISGTRISPAGQCADAIVFFVLIVFLFDCQLTVWDKNGGKLG